MGDFPGKSTSFLYKCLRQGIFSGYSSLGMNPGAQPGRGNEKRATGNRCFPRTPHGHGLRRAPRPETSASLSTWRLSTGSVESLGSKAPFGSEPQGRRQSSAARPNQTRFFVPFGALRERKALEARSHSSFPSWNLRPGCSMVTTVSGGTSWVIQVFPPMTDRAPITTGPRMVALE
jgi:hypothetical protein